MTNAITPLKAAEIMEAVIARGDLAALTAAERAKYYVRMCESVGLNPMTRPFEYITLNGKLILYARKDATDQLRALHNVSVIDLAESEREGVWIVTAKVQDAEGRTDAAKGAVTITGLKGEALANALMKAETKAKRRATLSLCGLGFLDESEVADIPAAAKASMRVLKKDHREDYNALLAELNAEPSVESLGEWREATAERVSRLPLDWQLRLSEQFDAALAFHRGESDVPPEEFQGTQWGERNGASMARVAAERAVTVEDAGPNGTLITLGDATASVAAKVAGRKRKTAAEPAAVTESEGIPPFLRRDTNGVPPWQGMIGQAWGTD